jgi:hypothetical protein
MVVFMVRNVATHHFASLITIAQINVASSYERLVFALLFLSRGISPSSTYLEESMPSSGEHTTAASSSALSTPPSVRLPPWL